MEIEWFGLIATAISCLMAFRQGWKRAKSVFRSEGLPPPEDGMERFMQRHDILFSLLISFVALNVYLILFYVRNGTDVDPKDVLLDLAFCRDRAVAEYPKNSFTYIMYALIYDGPVYSMTYYLRLRHLRETQPQTPPEQTTEEEVAS